MQRVDYDRPSSSSVYIKTCCFYYYGVEVRGKHRKRTDDPESDLGAELPTQL